MNVIWIISDTFRKDHLGCYGNKSICTPALDSLAKKSVQFNRHYAAGFPTMPARADFFTGRWTACFMRWEPLARNLVSLPQILTNKGYTTAAVVDTPFYTRFGFGYDRGFQGWMEIPGQLYGYRTLGDERKSWRFEEDRFAPKTFSKAMEWLELHYKEDFFLYIDAWDPHEPWDAPDYYTELYWPDYDGEEVNPVYAHWQDVPGMTEEKVKKAHACYCGECTMVDAWIGHFIKRVENMNLMDKTTIIFTTDHGFYFGEHNGLFGKLTRAYPSSIPYTDEPIGSPKRAWTRSPLFEELTACPLFIYMPGVEPSISDGITSAVDLMPTILDILDERIPESVEGKSILPMMKDTNFRVRDHTISTHPIMNLKTKIRSVDGRERIALMGSDTTVTTDEWTLLYSTEPGLTWLYHIPSDPKQENNVIDEHPEIAKELHQHFVKFMYDYNLSPELREPRLDLRL